MIRLNIISMSKIQTFSSKFRKVNLWQILLAIYWKIAHWGTACNTSNDYIEFDKYEFRFGTRWTAPIQVIAKLASMFPNVEFTHIYADEQFGDNCAYIEYRNGIEVFYFQPDTEEEYRKIYNLCW